MKSLLVLWEFGRRRLAKESRHLILISRLKMMKNELWCLACWQKLVIRGRSLPRITQLSKFHQLSLLVRWMGAKGTLLSRVDQGFLDNWTSKRRIFIESCKSGKQRLPEEADLQVSIYILYLDVQLPRNPWSTWAGNVPLAPIHLTWRECWLNVDSWVIHESDHRRSP